ncbi:MAG: HEAT repeat domain-containing protein [Dehalococcoidia bacterium]
MEEQKGEPARIKELVNDLVCDDIITCQEARRELVTIGKPAVQPLIDAMSNHMNNQWVRWEATKALGQIGDPAATEALIDALEDANFDIRWLAADSLVSVGRGVVPRILQRLIQRPESDRLRLASHHIFRDLPGKDIREILSPVSKAIEGNDPSVEVPMAAREALNKLK